MLDELLTTAEKAARAAGDVLRPAFRSGRLVIEAKEKNDFVTSADRAAEAAILSVLRTRFPEHPILAEESGLLDGAGSEFAWLIDPLDGTTNFLEGYPSYGVSIACRRNAETVVAVVYDPERDEAFRAARGCGADLNGASLSVSSLESLESAFLATGFPFKARAALDVYLEVFREVFMRSRAVRRCGTAALDLAHTAAGIFDGFFEFRLAPWDIAAGALLVEEAGGVVCDLDGGPDHLRSGNVLAGGAGVLGDLLEAVRPLADEALLDSLVPRSAAGANLSC